MRLQHIGLSFIIGSAIILYFYIQQDSLDFLNFAYSETSEILNLSNEIINSTFPQIKTNDNNIYVVWNGNVGHGINNEIQSDIFFTKSENKGNSFGEPINLSNNTGSSFNPQVEISSNNMYVVWEDDTLATTYDQSANTSILFIQSKDNETTFFPAVPLSFIDADSSNPDITTINGTTVLVVWQDNLDESSKILFIKSMSNKKTQFSDQQIISNIKDNNFEISPQIITSNNTINIIWDDFSQKEVISHILKRSSSNSGVTFGQVMQLSGDSEFAINDIINVYDNNVYIVWQGNIKGQFDIFLSKSSNGGITFSQPINLSNSTNADSINPQLAATANELFVVWQEDLSGNNQIYFTKVDA